MFRKILEKLQNWNVNNQQHIHLFIKIQYLKRSILLSFCKHILYLYLWKLLALLFTLIFPSYIQDSS